VTHDDRQPFARRRVGCVSLEQTCPDLIQTRAEALEQDLLLVRDVVVQRRFGNAQLRGKILERGVVIATLLKGSRSRQDDRVTLDVALFRSGSWARPGRCGPRELAAHGLAEHGELLFDF